MRLDNDTPFPARLLRFDRNGEGDISAVVVVKATFERSGASTWVPANEQLPFVEDRLDTSFGVFHTDAFMAKDGVDVCVLGTIRVERPVTAQLLSIRVGSHASSLLVSGDRRWVQQGPGLAASAPAPFVEMPLSYSRAYGGVALHDYERVTWADNPLGVGHYLSEEAALEQPLPNIEVAEGPPIRTWSERPPVAGWAPYPLFWGMRAREGVEAGGGPDGAVFPRIKKRLNNQAHPALVLSALADDASVQITGMRDRVLAFEPPRLRPIVEVATGAGTRQAEGQRDGLFIWLDAGRVTVTYRVPFEYAYIKGEERHARLFDACPEPGGHTWRV